MCPTSKVYFCNNFCNNCSMCGLFDLPKLDNSSRGPRRDRPKNHSRECEVDRVPHRVRADTPGGTELN